MFVITTIDFPVQIITDWHALLCFIRPISTSTNGWKGMEGRKNRIRKSRSKGGKTTNPWAICWLDAWQISSPFPWFSECNACSCKIPTMPKILMLWSCRAQCFSARDKSQKNLWRRARHMKPYRIEARILPLMHLNHDSCLVRASYMQDWLGKRCIQT